LIHARPDEIEMIAALRARTSQFSSNMHLRSGLARSPPRKALRDAVGVDGLRSTRT